MGLRYCGGVLRREQTRRPIAAERVRQGLIGSVPCVQTSLENLPLIFGRSVTMYTPDALRSARGAVPWAVGRDWDSMTNFSTSRGDSREDSSALAVSDKVAFAFTVFMVFRALWPNALSIIAHARTISRCSAPCNARDRSVRQTLFRIKALAAALEFSSRLRRIRLCPGFVRLPGRARHYAGAPGYLLLTYFSRRTCGVGRPASFSASKVASTMSGLPHR